MIAVTCLAMAALFVFLAVWCSYQAWELNANVEEYAAVLRKSGQSRRIIAFSIQVVFYLYVAGAGAFIVAAWRSLQAGGFI